MEMTHLQMEGKKEFGDWAKVARPDGPFPAISPPIEATQCHEKLCEIRHRDLQNREDVLQIIGFRVAT